LFSPETLQELLQPSHIHFEGTFSCVKNFLLLRNFSLEEDFKTKQRFYEQKLYQWIWNGDFIRSGASFCNTLHNELLKFLQAIGWFGFCFIYFSWYHGCQKNKAE